MENQLFIVLGRNKLLKNVDISGINLSNIKGKLFTASEGEILYREGDPADKIFLVISGEVNVMKKRTLGKAKSYIFNEDNFFGNDEFIEETIRFSTAVALRDSYLIALSRDEIEDMITQSREINLNLREPSEENDEIVSGRTTLSDKVSSHLKNLNVTLAETPSLREEKTEEEQFFKSIADTSLADKKNIVQQLEDFSKTPAVEPAKDDFDESVFLNEDGIPKAEFDLSELDLTADVKIEETAEKIEEPEKVKEDFDFIPPDALNEDGIPKPEFELPEIPEKPEAVPAASTSFDDELFKILSGGSTDNFNETPKTQQEDFGETDNAFLSTLDFDKPEAHEETETKGSPADFGFPPEEFLKQEETETHQEEKKPEKVSLNDFEAEEIFAEADRNIKSLDEEKKSGGFASDASTYEGGIMGAEQLEMIIKAAELVNSNIKIEEVLKNIVEVAVNLTNADRGTLYLLDREKNELWSLIAMGSEKKEIRLKLGEGLAGYVAKTGDILNIKDARKDSRFRSDFDKSSGYITKTVLNFPIKNNREEIIGVVQLLNSKNEEFTKLDEELLNAMSIHAALALQNAEMVEKLLQSERVQSLGKMANFLIQDIKKPILVSKRYAEHLKSKNLPPDNAQIVEMLLEQLTQVADIVQTTSSYSEGKTVLRMLNVSVNNTLTDYSSRIGAYVESRNCKIVNEYDKDATTKLDVKEFYQCYMHICKNACDAMPEGGTIYISTKKDDKKVKIYFRDNGLGIPDSFKDKVFEPFMTHGKKEGTGLGLSITKKIVEAHTGTIEVQSALGEGATFIITLPTISAL
ncbi:MAG: GAF domain-containing protein [Ignavibacteriales bacterium]|nr:GAF domain-containing protein [Ignavibacteriales bacterium]